MPIIVKEYTWSETENMVFIEVPLNGVKKSKVDIFCTPEFLKVSFPPFLFEVLLFNPIDDDKSAAKVNEGSIVFNLKKLESKVWGKLISDKSEDKKYVLSKKQEAIDFAHKRTEEKIKQKSEVKSKEKKYTLNEMMRIEEEEKSRIENIKENERIRTEKDMEEWKYAKREEELKERARIDREKYKDHKENVFNKTKSENIFDDESRPKIIELPDDFEVPSLEENELKPKKEGNDIFDDVKAEGEKLKTKNEKTKPITKTSMRESGNISFTFTPRVFPTPQRESKAPEEDEWLQRQTEARKICELDDPDLKDHEKDPEWLKSKASQLFKSGNIQGAVNAYNLAIRIQPKQPLLFLNRAACHLKLRNLYKCIEDSSNALELLNPPVQSNAKGRVKGHIRRGTAFCELELYAEGLQDYIAACNIDPKNEELKNDADKIMEIIEKGT